MESLPKNVEDYLRELTTLDVRAVDYYFDDSRGERGEIVAYDWLNPLQHPNLPRYRVVALWDLRHYDEKSSDYEEQIRGIAAKIIYSQKVQLLKDFEGINGNYLRFWKWYGEQCKLKKENRFDTFNFILGLPSFFVCHSNEKKFAPNTHSLAPRFLHNLHDAAMLKHGTLKRMIQEIKAIAPPVTTSTGSKLTHPQIALLYIYTHRTITQNNAQEIAGQYGQTSGDKLFREYQRLNRSISERTSSKNAVKDIESVMDLLDSHVQIERIKDELTAAKELKRY